MEAILKTTGVKVNVYKSKLRDTYINSVNCTTEYQKEELNFNK